MSDHLDVRLGPGMLRASSIEGIDLMSTTEVWVEWPEKYGPDSQQALDAARDERPVPTYSRHGRVLQFLWMFELFRTGMTEGCVKAVVYDEKVGQLLLKSFGEVRVLKGGQPCEESSATHPS